MDSMKIKALAPWFGADNMIAAGIARQLDGCDWVGIPCVGGASIIPHLTARSILASDVHRHLVNMANVVRDPVIGPKLYRAVRRLPLHPDVLQAAQARCAVRETVGLSVDSGLFQAETRPARSTAPDLEWAVDYFVCCWMGQGGRAGTAKEFDGCLSFRWSAGGGTSVGRWSNAGAGLPAWRRTLARAEFIVADINTFLATLAGKEKAERNKGGKKPRRGIYVDPPWPGPGDAYQHKFGTDRQRELAKQLATLTETRVVVRYGDHPLIRELYDAKHWTIIEQASRTQSNGSIPELLIINGPSLAKEAA